MPGKIEEEFYEYQRAQSGKRRYTPTIILLWDDIQTLHKKGNSLLSIYKFLKDKRGLTCCYESFRTIFNKMKEGKKEVNTVSDKEKSLKFPKVEKSQSKTVDVSFKPITSLDDGITEEEMKELMEQQKRILNRRN